MLNMTQSVCAKRIVMVEFVILLLLVCSMYDGAEASSCLRLRSSGLPVSEAEKEISSFKHSEVSKDIQPNSGSGIVHPPDLEDKLQLYAGKQRLTPTDRTPSPNHDGLVAEIQTESGLQPVHPDLPVEDNLQLFRGKGRLAPSDPKPPPGNSIVGYFTKVLTELGLQPVRCHRNLPLEDQVSVRNRRLAPSEPLPPPQNREDRIKVEANVVLNHNSSN